MAKDEMGSIITIGAVGLGAYWLYSSGFLSSLLGSPTAAAVVAPAASTPVVAAPPATPNPLNSPAAATPVWMTSLSALTNQLATMANASSANIDQWSFYYNQLRSQRNMPPLTPAQAVAIFAAEKIDPNNPALRATDVGALNFVNDIFNLGYGLQGIRRGMGAARRMNPIMRLGYRRVLA